MRLKEFSGDSSCLFLNLPESAPCPGTCVSYVQVYTGVEGAKLRCELGTAGRRALFCILRIRKELIFSIRSISHEKRIKKSSI